MKIDFKKLPEDDPLRNTPLSEIGAVYAHNIFKGIAKKVLPSYKIASKTFNELGAAWTVNTEWWIE